MLTLLLAGRVVAQKPLSYPLLFKVFDALAKNDTAKARSVATELEQAAIDSSDGKLATRARAILADVHVLEGNVHRAAEILYGELDRARAEDNWQTERMCLEQLGELAASRQCFIEAIEFFKAVRGGANDRDDVGYSALASLQIAKHYRQLGNKEFADQFYAEALSELDDLQDGVILYKAQLLRALAAEAPTETTLDELLAKDSQHVLSLKPLVVAARSLSKERRREDALNVYRAALRGREASGVPLVLEAKLEYATITRDADERQTMVSDVLGHLSGPDLDLRRLRIRADALTLQMQTYSLNAADDADHQKYLAEARHATESYEREQIAQRSAFLTAVKAYRETKERERDVRDRLRDAQILEQEREHLATERKQEQQRIDQQQQQYLWASGGAVLLCMIFVVGFSVRDRYRRRLRNLRVETDRKHREELREKLEARSSELESEMDRRLELERAFVQRDRFEAIGALTSGVAHDFNNLMTVVQSVSETVSSLARERLSEREREMLLEVLKAAKSGSEITRQLLQLTRGSGDLFIEPIVVAHQLKEIEPLLQRTVGEGIELDFDIRDPLATVKVESAQLTTSLINLCSNSRDAIVGKGVIKIRVETLAVEDKAFAQISVGDNGVGMTPDQLVKATKPLYSTKGPERASGLGLPIVQRFANRFEGELDISSSPAGTVVRIRLPAMTSSLSDEEFRMPNLAGLVVMVVDDKVSVLNSVTDTLRQLGCEAHSYHDVSAARIAIESGKLNPDLLLADIRLPDHSENESLADWVNKFAPSISVVLMAGSMTQPHEIDQQCGALLSKPFTQLELASALERALEDFAHPAPRPPAGS